MFFVFVILTIVLSKNYINKNGNILLLECNDLGIIDGYYINSKTNISNGVYDYINTNINLLYYSIHGSCYVQKNFTMVGFSSSISNDESKRKELISWTGKMYEDKIDSMYLKQNEKDVNIGLDEWLLIK